MECQMAAWTGFGWLGYAITIGLFFGAVTAGDSSNLAPDSQRW
ncbi:MAG: hypothetical protein JWM11_835 [Planctomycetaceae bacterium]|nr:hypothetical protein [Planctomycetaceae bacterium]